MGSRIVVWDPSGQFWEGAVVPDNAETKVLDAGGATLPCDPDSFAIPGAGYSRRSWGSGWPLDERGPAYGSPIAIYKPASGTASLDWVARVLPSDDLRAALESGREILGSIRVAPSIRGRYGSPSIAEISGGAANVVHFSRLGREAAEGGWIVGGRASVSTPSEEPLGLSLYGWGPGMRVAWLAVSLTY